MAGKKFSITAMIGVNSSMMGRGLKAAGAKMKAWAKKSMAMLKNAVKMGVMVAGAAMGAFAAKSVKEFASFEQGMNEVFTLLPGISKQSMGKMTDDVMNFSRSMGVIPEEVVPALYQALSAGVPKDNVFEFMETAVKASKAGVVDMNTAVDALSTVVNTYGKENITAARAADIMFEAVKMGKTTFGEMASTMYNVLPVAKAAGVSFTDISAAVATMTAKGTPTAQVMTQLKAAITSMIAPSSRSVKMFDSYGLSVKDLGDMIQKPGGLVKAMNMIKTATNGDMVAMKRLLGSSEALNAVLTLTSDGGRQFATVLGGMTNNSGQADAAFQRMNTGLMRSFEKMTAAFKVSMLKFGKALAPLLEKVTPAIMGIIANIDKINWAKLINGFARVWVIGLKPTFDAVGKAIGTLPWGNLLDFLLPIASLIIKTIQKIGKIIVGLSPAIIPLITTLAGYFTLLYGKFFLVVHFLSKMAPQIGAVWKEVLQIISAAMGFLIDPSAAKFKWLVDYIKKKFYNLGGAAGGLFKRIWEVIKETLGKIGGVVKSAFAMFVDSMWQSILSFLKKWPNVWKAVEGLVRMFKTLKHEITGEIMALKDAFTGMFGGVSDGGAAMEWLAKTGKWLSQSLGELIELTLKYYTALMKVLGVVIKVIVRLLTELAPALKAIIPVALKIAAAAVFFLVEGIKVLWAVTKLYLKVIITLITWLAKLEPVLMGVVSIISGFVMAVVEGIKAIWAVLKWLYFGAKEVLGLIAEAFVTAFYSAKKVVTDVLDFIIGLFKKLKDFVFEVLFGGTITKDFKKAFAYIETLVMKVLKGIFAIFKEFNKIAETVLLGVASVFKTIFKGIVKVVESVGEVVESIFAGIARVVKTMGNAVSGVFDSMGRLVTNLLKAFTNMGKIIEGIFGKIMELGGKAMEFAGKVAKGAGGLISSAAGKLGIGGGGGGGAKGANLSSGSVTSANLRTSLKPIVEKLTSMDGTLKSIDRTLKGKFVNQ